MNDKSFHWFGYSRLNNGSFARKTSRMCQERYRWFGISGGKRFWRPHRSHRSTSPCGRNLWRNPRRQMLCWYLVIGFHHPHIVPFHEPIPLALFFSGILGGEPGVEVNLLPLSYLFDEFFRTFNHYPDLLICLLIHRHEGLVLQRLDKQMVIDWSQHFWECGLFYLCNDK